MKVKVLVSGVGLFVTPMTIVYQAPLSVDSPGKNTGVISESRLQGIFPTQDLNPGIRYCRHILYCVNHQGSHHLTHNKCSVKLNFHHHCQKHPDNRYLRKGIQKIKFILG